MHQNFYFASHTSIISNHSLMTPTKESLEFEIAQLESTLSDLQTQRKETEAKLKYVPFYLWFRWQCRNSTDSAAAVQRHIRLLHEYNEIRDVALNFVGKIAEKERCRAIDVLKEYDMDEKD